MDKEVYMAILYDYYNALLTDKQKNYFEDYYFNNLTLSEIAENNQTSRSAIHKQVKEVANKLIFYEKSLELYRKNMQIKELIKDLEPNLKEKIEELI